LVNSLGQKLHLSHEAEVTLEANPEDITPSALESWHGAGINRISLGIQTFDPDRLKFLGRVHSADRAREALAAVRTYPNWSADLMFGWEHQTLPQLEADLEEVLSYSPPHVSLYQLTLEPRTRLGVLAAKNRVRCAEPELQAELYLAACDRLDQAGLLQYEVSNFARTSRESRHNRSYWERWPYVGLGPSAASLLRDRRSRNLASWPHYRDRLRAGRLPVGEVEVLTPEEVATERLWLGLRTAQGVPLESLGSGHESFLHIAENDGLVSTAVRGRIVLTRKGMALADELAARLLLHRESQIRFMPDLDY
jgi:oxygen-independent coproporphyrinogen-3 oxidase